jgi:hypothetical protein
MFSTAALSAGGHTLTAGYAGSGKYQPSTSAGRSLTVSADGTQTRLTSSLNPSVYGQAITLTATVTAVSPGSGKPAGTVAFYDGGTALGTATLANGVATLKVSSLSVGSHALTAVYNNTDGNYTTSTSTALTQTVNQAHTSTTLTSSAPTAAYGQPVTFTATVLPKAPGAGVPTGTVTFMDGSVVLGTVNVVNGTAQLITSTLARGKHSITAVYNGDAGFLGSTSAVLTETIT